LQRKAGVFTPKISIVFRLKKQLSLSKEFSEKNYLNMKKILLIASLFVCTVAFGQAKKDSTQYAELICSSRILSEKFDIYFVTSYFNPNWSTLPALPFVYPLDALNAYAKNGWHLVSSYVVPGNGYTLYFILEKDKI
jgi:hypothetical protein